MIPAERGEDEPQRTVLPNGTRVVSETIPGARSVSVGVWIGIGSRDEPDDLAGVSHFLEHLLFKGTTERSGRDIALAVDRVGGDLNAYTAKEHTVFYLRVPAAAAPDGLALLVELLTQPQFASRDVAAERKIILEELAGAEDNAEDFVDQLIWESLFPGHSLGREVIGTAASVRSLDVVKVRGFFETWYRPANLVVAAAGAIEHGALVAAVAGLDHGSAGTRVTRVAPGEGLTPLRVERRRTEQVHLALGWRGCGTYDDDRYALDVLEQVLGGGPSSRLFQEVREARSLAYSVYAAANEHQDCGGLTVTVGASRNRVSETLTVIEGIVEDLAANGITEEELAVAKGYLEGSLWLGLEDSASRMSRLGWSELSYGEVPSAQRYIDRISALSLADVGAAAARVLGGPRALAAVGPVGDKLFTRNVRP